MALSKRGLDDAIDTLSRPLTNLSLFYSYYNLAEVEEVYKYSFSLKKQTDKMKDAMYPYGVAIVIKELGHMDNKINFIKLSSHAAGEYDIKPDTYSELKRLLGKYYGNEYAGEIAGYFLGGNAPVGLYEQYIGQADYKPFEEIEDQFDIPTNVMDFLKAAELIFDGGYWYEEYGGEKWGTVARFLQNKDDIFSIVWVDTGFGIEHNTTTWLDKVELAQEEKDMLYELGYEPEDIHKAYTWEDLVFDYMMPKLLDAKRDGDFEEIYKIAAYTDNSLRKYTY